MTAWWATPEVLALMRVRRAAGVSFTAIAAEIGNGVTPNACIGAARRANHPRKRRTGEPTRPWTAAEVAVLRGNATLLMPGLLKLLPGRTAHGIQRKRTSLAVTGPPIGASGRTVERQPVPPTPVPAVALAALVVAHPPPLRRPPVVVPVAPPVSLRGSVGCQWIEGDPKLRGWKFCDAPRARIDRPYCLDHCQLAYGKAAMLREPVG